jgi:hypothetical protein
MISSLSDEQLRQFRAASFYNSGRLWKELEAEASRLGEDRYAAAAEEPNAGMACCQLMFYHTYALWGI